MGILDMPGQVIADGMVINTDYTLTARTADFGSLLYGDGITVDGISYQVREARKLDDGFFSELMLSKIEPSFYRLMLQNGDSLLLEDGYRILLEA
jgi:hypothetical protein